MNVKKPALIIVGIAVLIGIAFWAWPAKKPPEPKKVSATFVATGAEGLLKYVIEQLKLDKQHGLDLTIQAVEPGEVARRTIAREVDVGALSPIELVQSQQAGRDIRAFAPLLTAIHGLLVKTNSKYRTIDDLKGKKIAVLPKATAGYQSMALELKILGIDLEKEFSLTFGGIPDTLSFLKAGEVDAAFLPDPVAAQLIVSGQYRELLNLADLWKEKYNIPYFFNARVAYADWIAANLDTAEHFAAMRIEASKQIKDHPEIVAKYAREVVGAKTEAEVNFIVERLSKAFPSRWDDEFIDNAVFVMQKAAEFGFIKEIPRNPRELFTKF